MMKELPVRKPNRLKDYDYSQNGYYFVTICVKDKHELLGQIDVGANCVRPCLSEQGGIVEKEIHVLSETYADVEVNKYVAMPNHLHMVIVISDSGGINGNGELTTTTTTAGELTTTGEHSSPLRFRVLLNNLRVRLQKR